MYNPFKSKSKQTQTATFQTQQLQTEQTEHTMQFHTEEMQQTSSVNMQSTVPQKHGVFDKQQNVYGIQKTEIRNNFSDERVDAFHENLKMNVSYDRKPDWKLSKKASEYDRKAYQAYIQMMSSISHYADLSPTKTSRKTQASALSKAILSIKDYLAKYQGTFPALDKIAERYDLYFSTFCHGNMEQKTGVHINATTIEPELHTVPYATVHYADRRKDSLFPHEPSINDVKQGNLGDCYLLAGVSALINEHPEKIKECMKDNGDGTVTVRFYQKYSRLSEEQQHAYLLNRMDEKLQTLWKKTDDLSSLNDEELMFKFLQTGIALNSSSKRRDLMKCMRPNAFFDMIDKYAAEQKAAGKTLTHEERSGLITKFWDARFQMVNTLYSATEIGHAETTMKLATYLANVPEVKTQVIAYMRKALSAPNAKMDNIKYEVFSKLYQFLPEPPDAPDIEKRGPALLDTPEFHQLLDEISVKKPVTDDTMVPTYVTVTKEVPVIVKNWDIYSKDCLWLQMLEKAYAASGIHLEDADLEKINEEYQAGLKKLEQAHLSADEKEQKIKELDEKKYRQLRSYNAIIGGDSGRFIETLTGETKNETCFNQSTPDEIGKQFTALINELNAKISLHLNGFNFPISEIIGCATDVLRAKNVNTQEIKKDDGTTEMKEFYAKPLCIEDVLEAIQHPDDNMEKYLSAFCRTINRTFTGKSPKLQNLTIEGLKTILINAIKDVASSSDNLTIMYRSMSGKYTKRALIEYDRIQTALKKKIPISFGTRQYLPDGVNASGLNGESEQGGMVENHAYALIGTSLKDGKFFVRVRNPWAHGEMGYKTVKKDGKATLVPHEISAKTSGIFDMELNHFLNMVGHIEFNSTAPIN